MGPSFPADAAAAGEVACGVGSLLTLVLSLWPALEWLPSSLGPGGTHLQCGRMNPSRKELGYEIIACEVGGGSNGTVCGYKRI